MKLRSIVALSVAGVLVAAPAQAQPVSTTVAHEQTIVGTNTSRLTVVPNVLWWNLGAAIDAIQAAGFVVQTVPGIVDCGSPSVRSQSPAGGTSAPAGSTVVLEYNQQPGPGQECP
jgi:beta-lactam-binding protein with PASTA domain